MIIYNLSLIQLFILLSVLLNSRWPCFPLIIINSLILRRWNAFVISGKSSALPIVVFVCGGMSLGVHSHHTNLLIHIWLELRNKWALFLIANTCCFVYLVFVNAFKQISHGLQVIGVDWHRGEHLLIFLTEVYSLHVLVTKQVRVLAHRRLVVGAYVFGNQIILVRWRYQLLFHREYLVNVLLLLHFLRPAGDVDLLSLPA